MDTTYPDAFAKHLTGVHCESRISVRIHNTQENVTSLGGEHVAGGKLEMVTAEERAEHLREGLAFLQSRGSGKAYLEIEFGKG